MNEQNEPTWGIRFNAYPDSRRFRKGERPPDCPDWFESRHINTWQKQGLIVWSNLKKKIECLKGRETLRLLDLLISQDTWKLDGVSITCLGHEINVESPHRGQRKKTEPEPKAETTPSTPFYMEMLHLPPEAGPELISLLQANKDAITRIAEQEKRQFDEAVSRFWKLLLEYHRKTEQDEIDFSGRDFNWQRMDTSRWSCQYQTARGRICLTDDKWFWHACIDRPGYTQKSERLIDLKKCIEWVEKEIIDLVNQPEPEKQPYIRSMEQVEADRIQLRQKLLNGPFWIDATLLEAKQSTYKIFIELDAEPVTYKTSKSFCSDDTYRYDEHFLSPSKMSVALNLDFDHFAFEQPIGENSELYWITSLTTYYQESAAAEQAQKIWDHSQILQQFKAGKIKRARYGYKEVETGYAVFLGACEKPENLWIQPETRKDYLETQALRESLSFALDINDYRAFLGLTVEEFSDERLLHGMHKRRARSKYLPEEAQRESRVWLAQHEPIR
jgi:hypothetical protein